MRRVVIVVVLGWAGCAGMLRPAPSAPAPAPEAPAVIPRAAPTELPTEEPPAAEIAGDRERCQAAREQFQSALVAATVGCSTDDQCEAFMTCDAVTVPNAAKLWKLKEQSNDACQNVVGARDEVTCASGPPRCRDGRCQR